MLLETCSMSMSFSRPFAAVLLVVLGLLGSILGPVGAANAVNRHTHADHHRHAHGVKGHSHAAHHKRPAKKKAVPAPVSGSSSARVMKVVAAQAGDPYRWGSTGPNSFDCSGLVQYTFKKALGKTLPRTAREQYRAAKRIPASQARKGDLVFFGGNSPYHVGVYAGDRTIWHAPRTGEVVKKERLWTSAVSYGRVG